MYQVDHFTKMVLMAIVGMLCLIAAGLWMGNPRMTSPAYAGGIPDSGQQLDKILIRVEDINKSVDNLSALFLSGKVKVQLVDAKGKLISQDDSESNTDSTEN